MTSKLSTIVLPTYSENLKYADEFYSQNREHQNNALDAMSKNDIGQIISPCGTGKTRMQICALLQEAIRIHSQKERGIFLTCSHRLLLNKQLLTATIEPIIKCGLPFDILTIGSSEFNIDYEKYKHLGFSTKVCRVLSTLSQSKVESFIEQSKNYERHIVIVSTYDSVDRLQYINNKIDLGLFDEAHNLTSKEFTTNIKKIKPICNKQFYFTATRKVCGDNEGMNDSDFFGDIIYEAPAQLMLSKEEIVRPKLHIVKGANNEVSKSDHANMTAKSVAEAFISHIKELKDNSSDGDKIGAKVLISCNSIQEMEEIDYRLRQKNLEGVKIFSISSDGCLIDSFQFSKEEFLDQLNELSDDENAIILNVNMLTEGIDLPSITGVMLLRNLNLRALLQLTGRALRLFHLDRKMVYDKDYSPGSFDSYIKRYGWVIIPAHLSTLDSYESIVEIVSDFCNEFKLSIESFVFDEKYKSYNHKDLESVIPHKFKDGKEFDLIHEPRNIVDEAKINKLKDPKYLKSLMEYIKNKK